MEERIIDEQIQDRLLLHAKAVQPYPRDAISHEQSRTNRSERKRRLEDKERYVDPPVGSAWQTAIAEQRRPEPEMLFE